MESLTTEEVYVSFVAVPAGQNAHALENTWAELHVLAYIMRTHLTVLDLLVSFSFGEKFLDFWIMTGLIHLNLQG